MESLERSEFITPLETLTAIAEAAISTSLFSLLLAECWCWYSVLKEFKMLKRQFFLQLNEGSLDKTLARLT
jgi:hypothetical protein